MSLIYRVGKSGRAILQAISGGESNPKTLAGLTSGRLKCTLQDLERALEGRYHEPLQWCVRELLEDLNALDRRVTAVELRIGQLTVDYRDVIARLCTLPGVDLITAHTIIAEIGTDMNQFPDARHLASWAGYVPEMRKVPVSVSAGERAKATGICGAF